MVESMYWFEAIAVGLFGAAFGSFLNVVIHRLPRRQSIVTPRSRCIGCETPIPWYQNLPVISYLVLLGKCAKCGIRISPRYLVVEVMTALILVGLHLVWGLGPRFFLLTPFILSLIALFVIDLEHKLLPDAITKPGTLLALAIAPFNPILTASHPTRLGAFIEAVIGAAVGFGLLYGLAAGYERLRGVSGLGGGDIKLAAMIGALVGPRGGLAVLLFASIGGLIFGLGLMAVRRGGMQTEIPFGCFLTPALVLVMVLGYQDIWQAWEQVVLFKIYGVDIESIGR